ncbi:MAG: peptidylprolyl isomerase [Flavobacteriales bacterium]|nr:MAG: peptidylprolyl isomerase [Flavobacteriales bacterium]
MKPLPIVALVLSFMSCTEQPQPAASSTIAVVNQWADERMMDVLEAQEKRDATALCGFLSDSTAAVRKAAATALAAVQDSSARSCLISALGDAQMDVRLAVARALSYIADSTALTAMAAASKATTDTLFANAMNEAAFSGSLSQPHDAMWYVSYLESTDPVVRQRSAYRMARLKAEELNGQFPSILHALRVERDVTVARALMSALRTDNNTATLKLLQDSSVSARDPSLRIAAVRALGTEKFNGHQEAADHFFNALRDPDPGVSRIALDVLQKREGLDGARCWQEAQEGAAPHIQLGLYGLALKHGDEGTRQVARGWLKSMGAQPLDDYAQAELVRALANDPDVDMIPALLEQMTSAKAPVVRLAAAELAAARVREQMKRARFASREAQYAMLGEVVQKAIATNDAGLIAFACEQLGEEDSSAVRVMVSDSALIASRTHLHPVRDLETLQLIELMLAKRNGLPAPEHKSPPFNHPIDHERLLSLEQGQRYRIATTKGDIVIATNVNEAPGSSVAFDSLVMAGYYNGKAFHRVVPNFVIQGGCPRGDGYGGMPWTLRTEVPGTGFTAGSVGLASAGRDTESCQFFITHVPTPHLDGRYTKFADVVSGMDVVQRIVVGDRMVVVERVE